MVKQFTKIQKKDKNEANKKHVNKFNLKNIKEINKNEIIKSTNYTIINPNAIQMSTKTKIIYKKKFFPIIQNYNKTEEKNISLEKEKNNKKKLRFNILYYDEYLKSSQENNLNCSFFKMSNEGTFYGCHNFTLFQYICSKIKNTKKKFILISSGYAAEQLYNYCSNINEFKKYYIYCFHREKYLPLIQKYSKLQGVYNVFEDLKIQLSLEQEIGNGNEKENIKSSSLIYFNDYNKIYIKLHYEIIRKYFLYKLLKSNNNNSLFIDLVKKKCPYYLDIAKQLIYNDENDMIKFFKKNTDEKEDTIEKVFNCSHSIENYVSNYTLESFYYKYLNKFLREGNFKCFITLSNHISKFIYYLYEFRRNNISLHDKSNLFRNMYLSPEDFNIYLQSIGKVICYPSFTSTSLIENSFIPNCVNKNDQFVRLIIEQNNSKSVVSISHISKFPKEKEYLFLPFSFFKIKDIEIGKDNKRNPHIIHLIAINSEKPIEEMFLDFMSTETDNLDPEGLDMLQLCEDDTKIILNPNLLSKYYLNN